MNWRYLLLGLAAAALIFVACIYLRGADLPVLHPQGPVGLGEQHVIMLTALLCSIVVVPVFFLLFFFAWRYKAGDPTARRTYSSDWDHYNWIAELFWWLIPTAIIVALSFIAWDSSHTLDPYKPLASNTAPLTVDVVALDWKWLFIYPDLNIATVNMLEIPQNTPIHFYITADAPMNSFWIPALGGQIMAMPGMETQLNLMANNTGVYNGASANISGEGFAGMHFSVHSVSADEFGAWVSETSNLKNPLTSDVYSALAATSTNNPVTLYSSVEQNLYTDIVAKFMAPDTAAMQGMTMTH